MLNTKSLLLSLSMLVFASCGALDELNKSDESDTKNDGSIESQIRGNGYYLNGSIVDESQIPEELRDEVALFHISLQSGESPVLSATLNVLEDQADDCTTEVIIDTIHTGGGSSGEINEIGQANLVRDDGDDVVEVPVDPMPMPMPVPTECNTRVVKQSFGPNEDSNFFSVIIKRTESINLDLVAEGFTTKQLIVDGSKAKFLVLSIQLEQHFEGCYYSSPEEIVSSAGSATSLEYQVDGSDSSEGVTGGLESNSHGTTNPRICPDGGNHGTFPPDDIAPPIACAEIYAPVCGIPRSLCEAPEGVACPAVEAAPTTYGNVCSLNNAGAELLYEGECK